MCLKDFLKKTDSFFTNHRDSIQVIISILMLSIIVIGILQANASFKQSKNIEIQNDLYKEQLKLTQEIFNFQYKPQILIEIISPRKNSWFTPRGYEEPNYIQIYENDFSKSEVRNGEYGYTGDFSIPLKIKFYNFGSIGTKIEKIESVNSCNSQGKKSWQMDIMDTRILQPKEVIEYNMFYHHDSFDNKPINYTFCDYNITYTFFNGFQINESYKIHYNPFNYSSKDLEIENYYKFIEERKLERLKN